MSVALEALTEARAILASTPCLADLPVPGPLGATERQPPSSRGPGSVLSGEGPLLDAARRLRAGDTTAAELLEQARAAIDKRDAELHAVVELLDESADRAALVADAEMRAGRWRGPLHGIPLTVKDVLHFAGVRTRAGSRGFRADPTHDAVAVERIRAAGGIFVAKVATHELALGVTTPQVAHPLDGSRIAGGSSGGSAIAVATSMGLGSIGTDTRASIRVPAALCGIVGFKPTYGLVPTQGVVTLSWTMDHVGPLASTVADAAEIAAVLVGAEAGSLSPAPNVPLTRTRVGVPPSAMIGASEEVARVTRLALRRLESAGVDLVETNRPSCQDFELAGAAGLVISRCEALAFHRSAGTEFDRLWPETADQLRAAESIRAAEYVNALRIRAQLASEMLSAFSEPGVCAIALPTTLVTAPHRNEAEKYLTLLARNVIPWSLLGWPAVSVPSGNDESGLPVGLQIVAPPHHDRLVLHLALMIESALGDTKLREKGYPMTAGDVPFVVPRNAWLNAAADRAP